MSFHSYIFPTIELLSASEMTIAHYPLAENEETDVSVWTMLVVTQLPSDQWLWEQKLKILLCV